MTYIDVRKTLELLAYLGYIENPEENQLSAIHGESLLRLTALFTHLIIPITSDPW